MGDDRAALERIRQNMLIGTAAVRELAGLALQCPPEVAVQIEHVVALCYECVTEDLEVVTALLDASPLLLHVA